MKSKRVLYKGGFGLEQIAAMLLLVLPALAFIVMLLSEYTAIMHIDNKLKLIANLLARVAAQQENVRDWSVYTDALNKASSLCPAGTSIVALSTGDAPKNEIEIIVQYDYKGNYFDKKIKERLVTYSYHDQNLTATLECR